MEQLRQLIERLKSYEGCYTVIIGDCSKHIPLFKDSTFDFVFIDGAHDYRSVRRDILQCWSKLCVGGLMVGHDYDSPYHTVDRARMLSHSYEDYTPNDGKHYGVIRAVGELFPKVGHFRRFWFIRKNLKTLKGSHP